MILRFFLCVGLWILSCSQLVKADIKISSFNSEKICITAERFIPVSGYVSDVTHLFVNGEPVTYDLSGFFKKEVPLHIGENKIPFLGFNVHSKKQFKKHLIIYCIDAFSDVQQHWAQETIEQFCAAYEIKGRYGSRFFQPDEVITRGELAHILVQIFGFSIELPSQPTYQDVLLSHWAYPYIETVNFHNVMFGTSASHFSPQGMLNRLDICLIVSKLAQKEPSVIRTLASDLPIGFWGNQYIVLVYNLGLFPDSWMHEKVFKPYKGVTRAELIWILSHVDWISRDMASFFHVNTSVPVSNTVLLKSRSAQVLGEVRIKSLWADPLLVSNSHQNIIKLHVSIDAQKQPQKVVIDLSPVGRLSNLELFDDGRWLDDTANDGIYSAGFKMIPGIGPEMLHLPVAVIDKNHYQSTGEIDIEVVTQQVFDSRKNDKPPEIADIQSESAQFIYYEIKHGDSIAKVSQQFLGDSAQWKLLSKINNLAVTYKSNGNGKKYPVCPIFPGKILKIPKF